MDGEMILSMKRVLGISRYERSFQLCYRSDARYCTSHMVSDMRYMHRSDFDRRSNRSANVA